jgi:hypothetical protein
LFSKSWQKIREIKKFNLWYNFLQKLFIAVNLLDHTTNWRINKKITNCGPHKGFYLSWHPHLLQNSFDFLHTWTGCRIRKERVPASWGVVEAVLSSTQVEYEFRVLDEVLLTRCAWYHGVQGQGAEPIGSRSMLDNLVGDCVITFIKTAALSVL